MTFVVGTNTTAIQRKAGRMFSVTRFPPDLTRPTVSIKTPSPNAVLNDSMVTLTGTASDVQGVDRVEYQLGSNAPHTADGMVAWSAALELVLGTNTVQVWSVDSAGNYSITNSRSFY